MNNTYLVFTKEQDATLAEQKISEKMGFPTENTTCWAIPTKAYNDNLWFFISPAVEFLVGLDINYQVVTSIDNFIAPFEIDLG